VSGGANGLHPADFLARNLAHWLQLLSRYPARLTSVVSPLTCHAVRPTPRRCPFIPAARIHAATVANAGYSVYIYNTDS